VQRLREYDVVTITLPADDAKLRNGCFECDVVAIMGNTTALEARDRSEVLWLPERVDGAFMSFRRDRELVGLKGILTTKDDVGDLRFTVSDGVQRRRRTSSRLEICAPITLTAGGEQVGGVTLNVSADGILAESDLRAAIGDEVEFVLSLPGVDEALEGTASVLRQNEGLMALEFGRSQHELRSRLGMFVLEHNRAALRRTRGGLVEAEF
jgi:hypothetical protein